MRWHDIGNSMQNEGDIRQRRLSFGLLVASALAFVWLSTGSPVYAEVIYETDFNQGLPAGWTVVDGFSDGLTWTSDNPKRLQQMRAETFMIVDSDGAGVVDMNETLVSPIIDCSGCDEVILYFWHQFASSSRGGETGDVDIRVDNGPWQNVRQFRIKGSSGSIHSSVNIILFQNNIQLDLSSWTSGHTNVQLRWHYYDARYNSYWGIDDVRILDEPEAPVSFKDPRLKAAIEKELGISDPTPIDMLSLTSLSAQNVGIDDLTGIEYAQNLSSLILAFNAIDDLSALSTLTNLTYLGLPYNQIYDLSALSALTSLTTLYLHHNFIDDLSDLSPLTDLSVLFLGYNRITDLSALAPLTKLAKLKLYSNQLNNVSVLSSLTNLTELDLSSTQISDLSILSPLTNLTELKLGDNPIADVSALSPLTSLTSLTLNSNKMLDLSTLPRFPSLIGLNLYNSDLNDVSALSSLTSLTDLNLGANRISDASALAPLTNLTSLDLGRNNLSELSTLPQFPNLTDLDLGSNGLNDVSALSLFADLTDLDLSGNDINDISALSSLINLTNLDLGWNDINDISALSSLINLRNLGLSSNDISSISALGSLTNLTELDLKYNKALIRTAYYCVDIPVILGNNPSLLRFSCDPKPPDIVCPQRLLFVDNSVNEGPGNNGFTWQSAFKHLQDALAIAKYGNEIRVAQGVYRPDQGLGMTQGDRDATFQVKAGVTIKGGYPNLAGIGVEIDPNQSNTTRFETILSGDLAGNDDESWVGDGADPSRQDNSRHVVSVDYADSMTVLDGFTITAGHASPGHGGGVNYENSNHEYLTIAHCKFLSNYAASRGGGLYCSRVTLDNCDFINNHSEGDGGGIRVSSAIVQGCEFRNNSAGNAGGGACSISGASYSDCNFVENTAHYAGALTNYTSRLSPGHTVTFENVEIQKNFAAPYEPNTAYFHTMNIRLAGDLYLNDGSFDVSSVVIKGSGSLNIANQAVLRIVGGARSHPTAILSAVHGPGDIVIDASQELMLVGGDAIVNLSGSSQCNPDPNTGGRIIVNGSLVVRANATLESTNIDVKLLDVNTPNDIQYNNITLLESSTGFGGEFFVADNVTIRCNNIVSEGDRYLDLDPNPYDVPPTLENNRITVVIKEGILGSQGTLLELRAKDYDGIGISGAYPVSEDSPGFTDDPSENWVLEKLILEPGSKLNLTNRQGFEFQDVNDPNLETVYVKDLVMGPNSILNTGLQTLYYQRLMDPNGNELIHDANNPFVPLDNGARFMDIPVLGFSLGIIAMDDQTPSPHNEFDIRVRKRLTDPGDVQTDPNHPTKIGLIERIDSDPGFTIPPGHGGIMDMRAQAPGRQSASSVAAKGAFARVGDEHITIEFEYMFREDPADDAEIIVYLSDHPEVSNELVEVARIRAPAPGRPGSIGSHQFAVFSGKFLRGELNFTRGTYVELELRGQDARCWIDNWDPKVNCTAICGDYDNSDLKAVTNIYDYLVLLAEYGLSNPGSAGKGCLDLVGDGCVNIDDLQAWKGRGVLNRCGQTSDDSANAMTSLASLASYQSLEAVMPPEDISPLLILGKPYIGKGRNVPESVLFSVSSDSNAVDVNHPGFRSMQDGRLVCDHLGNLYQVSGTQGLLRLDRDKVTTVVESSRIEQGDTTILIGVHDAEGFLVQDCAFDPRDASIVYVVPVMVDQGHGPYAAAAKLEITGGGDYEVLETYGVDPATDPNQSHSTTESTGEVVLEPDMQHLHEIEIDARGKYLYVLSRYIHNNNDRVLRDCGNFTEQISCKGIRKKDLYDIQLGS